MPRRRPPPTVTDHALELLLAYDGRMLYLPRGYCLKFEIRQDDSSAERPHGLRYSFTLHDGDGTRILGFDNAHRVRTRGGRRQRIDTADHWHPAEGHAGVPYQFTTAAQLVEDFFTAAMRELERRNIDFRVTVLAEEQES